MTIRTATKIAAALAVSTAFSPAAFANTSEPFATVSSAQRPVLDDAQAARVRAAFAAIDRKDWTETVRLIDSISDPAFKAVVTSQYYLSPSSPTITGDKLEALLQQAPWLPDAARLGSIARERGASRIPAAPIENSFRWLGSAPTRGNPKKVSGANGLRSTVVNYIKDDNPSAAERVVDGGIAGLSSEARAELQQRVAWSYYIENDDRAAQRVAALARGESGEWAAMADWVYGLASWRLGEFDRAAEGFRSVAERSYEPEMKAAGQYWEARSFIASGKPEKVQPLLQSAAQQHETFYGLLAGEMLGIEPLARVESRRKGVSDDELQHDEKLRLVLGLSQLGQSEIADGLLRHFAKTGNSSDHARYLSVARRLGLPETQLWLAHYGPSGASPESFARYPAPDWKPLKGWRVDRSLAYAHALQESRFKPQVVSHAGARGLMQIMPGTARGLSARNGVSASASDLNKPEVNLEFGQTYLEMLADMSQTDGLLPKIMAAYNAGPAPVGRWRDEVNDGGDPLLFIESIPYWETREYVGTVMRNYWMYEAQVKPDSISRQGLAQNMWPRFPTAAGATNVRLTKPKAPSLAAR